MTDPTPHPALAVAALVRRITAFFAVWLRLRGLFDREKAAMERAVHAYIVDTLERFERLLHTLANAPAPPPAPVRASAEPPRAPTRARTPHRAPRLRRAKSPATPVATRPRATTPPPAPTRVILSPRAPLQAPTPPGRPPYPHLRRT